MSATAQVPPSETPRVHPDLVRLGLSARDATEAITRLGQILGEQGYVKQSWIRATTASERIFPTGLPTPGIQVAIPHADPEHVLRPGVAAAILARPVTFGQMGTPGATVSVRIVLALAATNHTMLISLLRRLMQMFQKPDVLGQLLEAESAETLASLVNQHLTHED